MIKEELEKELIASIIKIASEARKGGLFEGGGGPDSPSKQIMRTTDTQFGDFTTNVALLLSSASNRAKTSHNIKQSPMEFANKLTHSLGNLPYVKKLEVKEPGFINFFVKDEVWQKEVSEVLKEGSDYGSNDLGKGKVARVEFVSANPTGPLHFGNARGGPIGDGLASVLEFSGYKVFREYLHNDIGGQVEKLGQSIVKIQKGQKPGEDEYKGGYVNELAKKISPKSKTPNSKVIGEQAVDILLKQIISDCAAMGVKFDDVYPESEFTKDGETKKVLDLLENKGVLKKKDGATWFVPSDEFLKDRETVVVKSDGSFTYFANDIAYHNLKFADNPDLVIDVFGANHHGHVPRLQAVIKALGFDVSKFHVILYQWVRFKRGDETVKMSKRAGTFITAKEVIDEVGKDAVRFFILMHDPNSHIDFDLDLAREKSSKNPVYYVQYAHARISSILAKAKVKSENRKSTDYGLLTTDFELNLIKQITRLPELVEEINRTYAVHRLTSYAREIADSFHKFYENCPVLESEEDLRFARLSLCKATEITLKNTLSLLGVSAPSKM